jgi:putative drug exporter of the RND superfamily
MSALTRFVLRHQILVLLLWTAATVAGIATLHGTAGRLTNSFAMPGASFRTAQRVAGSYGSGGGQPPYLAVLTAPAGQTVTVPSDAATADRAFRAASAAFGGSRLVDHATTGDPAFLVAGDRTTFALLYLPSQTLFGGPDPTPAIQHALSAAAPGGWWVGVTGHTALAAGAPSSSKGTGIIVEAMLGALGALLVLGFVFGSLLAVLPLLIALVSVMTSFLAVGGLTELTSISQIVEFLIALIGLGVAIDYSLLVVTRWREERSNGRDNHEAVIEAMRHAGRAVVFSGLTVAIGLLSLMLLPVPMLRSVGFGGMLVPLVSVAVSVTLLPVVLDTVGPLLDWPRWRDEHSASRLWSGWARLVYRHRWVSATAGLLVLGALALPALSMHVGDPSSPSQATSGPAHDALATLTRGGVPTGVLSPIQVLTTAQDADRVAAQARTVTGVHAVLAPATADSRRDRTALIDVLPTDESYNPAGQDTVARVERALTGQPGVLGITGDGAGLLDFTNAVYGRFPFMLAVIGAVTFVLLARAFRSLLMAAKAVLLNLVSLAAAYGVITLVFQQGHGSNAVFGVPATGAITMWVPLMVFAFLFGLSMDYEVFILARIREEYDASGQAEQAVTQGLGRTGRLVTSAALILMFSFVSMSTGPQTDLKILATGLGVGIAVDAVVVRCLLVPALVALFGRWNWWMPRSAARLLRIPALPVRPLTARTSPSAG